MKKKLATLTPWIDPLKTQSGIADELIRVYRIAANSWDESVDGGLRLNTMLKNIAAQNATYVLEVRVDQITKQMSLPGFE